VHLTPHAEPLLPRELRAQYFQLVNSGFRHKRKNIANSLADETGLTKPILAQTLTEAGIDPTRRAQTLSVQEWLVLLGVWQRRIGSIGV
jgi:16S rRNA (adenine1518-N6/adenine1519-N6)-dimethyltransferase